MDASVRGDGDNFTTGLNRNDDLAFFIPLGRIVLILWRGPDDRAKAHPSRRET